MLKATYGKHNYIGLQLSLASLFRSIQLLPSKHVFLWLPADDLNPAQVIAVKPDVSEIISIYEAAIRGFVKSALWLCACKFNEEQFL